MHRKIFQRTIFVLFIFLICITGLCLTGKQFLVTYKIDPLVVTGANVLLFILSLVAMTIHYKAVQDPNPNVFIRSVLMTTLMKFFVIAGATFLYLLLAGTSRNVYVIPVGMVLYLIYTIIEVRGGYKLNAVRN